MIRKLIYFWYNVGHYLITGACFTGWALFTAATFQAEASNKILLGWCIAAMFFAAGAWFFQNQPSDL